jgi:hypothetical protein
MADDPMMIERINILVRKNTTAQYNIVGIDISFDHDDAETCNLVVRYCFCMYVHANIRLRFVLFILNWLEFVTLVS